MARVVYITLPGGWGRQRDRLYEGLAGLAFAGAVVGAASTGWTRGGFLWACLYGFLAFISFPIILGLCTLVVSAMYPILKLPGAMLASQLGWTADTRHALRGRWLERISALLILLPIALLLQRNAWSVFSFLASLALLGLVLLCLLIVVPVAILMYGFLYAMSRDNQSSEVPSDFRWTKVDAPRLPPPDDER